MEITKAKQEKERRKKRNEDSLRDLCNSITCTNILICRGPRRRRERETERQEREREKGAENICQYIIAENFPNLEKESDIQVQEAQTAQTGSTQRRPYKDTPYLKWQKLKIKATTKEARRQDYTMGKRQPPQ